MYLACFINSPKQFDKKGNLFLEKIYTEFSWNVAVMFNCDSFTQQLMFQHFVGLNICLEKQFLKLFLSKRMKEMFYGIWKQVVTKENLKEHGSLENTFAPASGLF